MLGKVGLGWWCGVGRMGKGMGYAGEVLVFVLALRAFERFVFLLKVLASSHGGGWLSEYV